MSVKLRLFVGVYPPVETAEALLRDLHALAERMGLGPLRPTRVEQVHLTLQFIGAVAAHELPAVQESVARSAAGLAATALTPRRLIRLPERGSARLIAAETDTSGVLRELKTRLALRLAHGARREPARAFLPHLTLARFRAPTRLSAFEAPLELPAFPVTRISLMRSVLRPGGAVHHEVDVYPLDA